MSLRRYLVTGGLGFLGSTLVRRLVKAGHTVRILDNASRGAERRLLDVRADVEIIHGDIRNAETVRSATKQVDSVCHLAYINGTEYFYQRPAEILEVGVKGMLNVLDACLHANVGELILASSSEVYQTPPSVPTSEKVPLVVPELENPRYSYGGGKIISELMAMHYGRQNFERVLIFRPHNVYGPDMGWEHVIPQLITKLHKQKPNRGCNEVELPIQGTGLQSRAFVYIEDFVSGVMLLLEKGTHLMVYNIGTTEEVAIQDLAKNIASCIGVRVKIIPGEPAEGGTLRRCPDMTRLHALGYRPRYSLAQGLPLTVDWYWKQLEIPGSSAVKSLQ